MYSAPRSRAIASWTGRGSGRVTRLIVRPRVAPPVAAAAPSTPARASSRRRDGSVGADIRRTDQVATRAIARHTRPVMAPSRALPLSPTASATRAESSAEATTMEVRRDITHPVYRTNARAELGAFPLEVEEGHRYDGGADLPSLALHGPFDRDPRTWHREPLLHQAEPDHLLDRRPPPHGCRPPDLHALPVDRDRGTLHLRRDLGGEPVAGVHRFYPGPVELQAHQPALGSPGFALGEQRPLARELGHLVELHETTQTDLERRVLQLRSERVPGACVLSLDQDQARLQAADVQGLDPCRPDAVAGADLEEVVPHGERFLHRDPQLVAEVAGVAGPRHVDVGAGDPGGAAPEVSEVEPVLAGRPLQHVPGQAPLQGQGRRSLRDVVDPHIEPGRVQ